MSRYGRVPAARALLVGGPNRRSVGGGVRREGVGGDGEQAEHDGRLGEGRGRLVGGDRVGARWSSASSVGGSSPGSRGRVNQKREPCPGSPVAPTWPPIASTRRRTMDRPSPTPPRTFERVRVSPW